MPETKLVAAMTGHRPNKLYGYDLKAEKYMQLRMLFAAALEKFGASELWTGMALGADQTAALAVLDMKNRGKDIRLNAAIPFPGQESKWPETSKQLYNAILSKCDRKAIVTNGPYSPKAMQDRNIYMVDRADYVIAIYDESGGGTGNCVDYARRHGVPVLKIDPSLAIPPVWLDRPDGFRPCIREKRRHS